MVVSSPNRDPNRNQNNPQSKEAHRQLQSEGLRFQEVLRRLHHRDLGVDHIQSGEVRMCGQVFLAKVVDVRELEGPRENVQMALRADRTTISRPMPTTRCRLGASAATAPEKPRTIPAFESNASKCWSWAARSIRTSSRITLRDFVPLR